MTDFILRNAAPGDEALICALLGELADFEKLRDRFFLTEAAVRRDITGPQPVAQCLLAFEGDVPAGIAVWFWTYRSFRARRGLFVEDLYVRPDCRGRGLGRRLLGGLAHIAREAGGWMEWLVLDWNEGARSFYASLGAAPVAEWLAYRLEGDALTQLAGA